MYSLPGWATIGRVFIDIVGQNWRILQIDSDRSIVLAEIILTVGPNKTGGPYILTFERIAMGWPLDEDGKPINLNKENANVLCN